MEFGVTEDNVGGWSITRQLEQVSATGPGSITTMSRLPRSALLAALMLTDSVVGEVTWTELTCTPVLETKTVGVPENPVPVRVIVFVAPWASLLVVTAVIDEPGVVI